MFRIDYKGDDGLSLSVSGPLALEEITYSAFLDFRKAEERYFGENKIPGAFEAPAFLAEALSYIFKVEGEGDLSALPFALPGDEEGDIVSTPSIFAGDEPPSVLRLYGYLIRLLETFDPETYIDGPGFRAEYKGEVFFIEPDRAKRAVFRKAYTLGEVVEITEIERIFSGWIEKNGDPGGELEFERELRILAILLRKAEEKIPLNRPEFDAFIEARARHFQELPFPIVVGARFFLAGILKRYGKTPSLPSSSKGSRRYRRPWMPTKLKRKPRPKKGQRKSGPISKSI